MKIFLTALLGLILVCSAKDLAFKDSGIKSRALDQAFLKTILEYQGELTKDIIEKTLELGVTQVFVDASVRVLIPY